MGWWWRVEVAALNGVSLGFDAADAQGIRTLVVDAVGSVLAAVVEVITVVTNVVTVLHLTVPTYD